MLSSTPWGTSGAADLNFRLGWIFPLNRSAAAWQQCLQICGCWHEVWGQVCWACCRSSRAVWMIHGRSSWPAGPAGRPPQRPGQVSGWSHTPSSDKRVKANRCENPVWHYKHYEYDVCRYSVSTDHIKSSEDVAVVVTGLEVFGDVGKCREILRILSGTRDVANLMFCYDVLQREGKKRR